MVALVGLAEIACAFDAEGIDGGDVGVAVAASIAVAEGAAVDEVVPGDTFQAENMLNFGDEGHFHDG